MACLSNIVEIDREQCIGNSLPIINDNFFNVKNYVCDLEKIVEEIIAREIFHVPLFGIINFYGDIVLGGSNFDLVGRGKLNTSQGIDLRAYHLCNGQDGTPDLRDRFVVGSGGSYTHKAFGPLHNSTASLAFSSVKLTIPEMPIHNHGITDQGHKHGITDQGHSHDFALNVKSAFTTIQTEGGFAENDSISGDDCTTESATTGIDIVNATTDITINNEGGSVAHENRPPYMALAFIMRYKV